MNNKGFGIPHIMAFAIFVIVVIYVFTSFISSITKLFSGSGAYRNYKNVYKQYIQSSSIIVPNQSNYNYEENNQTYSYPDIELKLADAGKKYMTKKNIKLSVDESYYISLDKLRNDQDIEFIKDPYNDSIYCFGYTKVINAEDSMIYKGYLMCGNSYKTIGYDNKYSK